MGSTTAITEKESTMTTGLAVQLDAMRWWRLSGPFVVSHDSNLTAVACLACGVEFRITDSFALIALGPGPDAVEQEAARSGDQYSAVAVAVHWLCATGYETVFHTAWRP